MQTYRARLERWVQYFLYPGIGCLVLAQFLPFPFLDILLYLSCFGLGIATGLLTAGALSFVDPPESASKD
jgi:hypothetical protein